MCKSLTGVLMRRLFLRPVLPILWIIVGVELSYLWGIIQPIDPALIELLNKRGDIKEISSSNGEINFSESMRAIGRDWESTGYSSSDGVFVAFTERSCSTHSLARHVLEEKLRDAAQILERSPRFNARGKQIGERVVAIFPTEYRGIQKATVFWTHGAGLISIDSPSLQHAL